MLCCLILSDGTPFYTLHLGDVDSIDGGRAQRNTCLESYFIFVLISFYFAIIAEGQQNFLALLCYGVQ